MESSDRAAQFPSNHVGGEMKQYFCNTLTIPQLFVVAFAVLLAAGCGKQPSHLHAKSANKNVAIAIGDAGLSQLSCGDVQLLQKGSFNVKNIYLQRPDGTTVNGSVMANTAAADKAAQKVVLTYKWGAIACVYQAKDNQLLIDVDISNTTADQTITEIDLEPLILTFPKTIQKKDHDGSNAIIYPNTGDPSIILIHDEGDLSMAFCNEDVVRPLEIAIPAALDNPKNQTFPLLVRTNARDFKSWPVINRPICARCTDHFSVSLRFGGKDATNLTLAGDIIARFRQTFPYRLNWPDRRPIAALYLATSHTNIAENWPKNPRGWCVSDPAKLDITTDAGRAIFKERLMTYATNCVRILKEMNAQGFMLTDSEGQEWPHACSYLGDPRSIPAEFDSIVDEFFKTFKDAGLRTGLCIRPTRPLRPAYGTRVDQYDLDDPLQNMIDKVDYAKKRWGCTLIYVDSNVDPVFFRPMDATIFRKLADAFPDVLFFPEHQNTLYYAYVCPTDSYTHHQVVCTPQSVLDVYPEAFSTIYIPDRDMKPHWKEFVTAVKRGDILVFRGWFDDPANNDVKKIYHEAGR
jgi:hypothetical protein